MALSRLIFFLLLAFAASPWAGPASALVLGMAFGLTLPHPYARQARSASRLLLQGSIVALGFGMDLNQVLAAGASGALLTFLGLTFAIATGMALGHLFGVASTPAYLVSVGTAICGGSAIAAVAPVVRASDEEISVSLGTVFLLNAAGLLIFPPLGRALGLEQWEFGLWAALAIHDTSSVVGAGAKYGALALAVATTVKLTRALWIVPLTLLTAAAQRGRGQAKIQWPWFILFFLLAAMTSSYFQPGAAVYSWAAQAGRIGLVITLFLIGTGISRQSLRTVSARPLILGVVLWFLVATASLLLVRSGWMSSPIP